MINSGLKQTEVSNSFQAIYETGNVDLLLSSSSLKANASIKFGGDVGENNTKSISSKDLNDIDAAGIEIPANQGLGDDSKDISKEFKIHFDQFDSESFHIAAEEFIKKVKPGRQLILDFDVMDSSTNNELVSTPLNSKNTILNLVEEQTTNLFTKVDEILKPDSLNYDYQSTKRVTFQETNDEFLFENLKKQFEIGTISNYNKKKVNREKEKSVAGIIKELFKMENNCTIDSHIKELNDLSVEDTENIKENQDVFEHVTDMDLEKAENADSHLGKLVKSIEPMEILSLIDDNNSSATVSKCASDDTSFSKYSPEFHSREEVQGSSKMAKLGLKKSAKRNQEHEIANPFQNVYVNTTTQQVKIYFKFTHDQLFSISKTPIKFEYRHGCGSCKVPIEFCIEEELIEGNEMEITGSMKCLCGREWKWRSFMEKERVLYFVINGMRFHLVIPYELCYLKK